MNKLEDLATGASTEWLAVTDHPVRCGPHSSALTGYDASFILWHTTVAKNSILALAPENGRRAKTGGSRKAAEEHIKTNLAEYLEKGVVK